MVSVGTLPDDDGGLHYRRYRVPSTEGLEFRPGFDLLFGGAFRDSRSGEYRAVFLHPFIANLAVAVEYSRKLIELALNLT